MCQVELLRALLNQRLSAAVDEVFGVVARTIAEYQEELCRSKEENERQRQLLDAVLKPHVVLYKEGLLPRVFRIFSLSAHHSYLFFMQL